MTKRQKQNSDHAQRDNTPTIDNEAIANHLEALKISERTVLTFYS